MHFNDDEIQTLENARGRTLSLASLETYYKLTKSWKESNFWSIWAMKATYDDFVLCYMR